MFRPPVLSESLRRRFAIPVILAILAALSAAFAPPREARAALEEEDVPAGVRFQVGTGRVGMGDLAVRKKPASLKGEKAGTVNLGRVRLPFILFQSEKNDRLDSLIIDLNNNRNLTDDPVLPYPAREAQMNVEIQTRDGRKTQVRIQSGGEKWFSMLLTRWYRGVVEIGGKKVAVALVDGDLNGLKPGTISDYLIMDADGDGRLEEEAGKARTSGMRLPSTILFEKVVYKLVLDIRTPDVVFKPYDGPCGSLALDLPFVSAWADAAVTIRITDRWDRDTYILTLSEDFTIPSLPAGTYDCSMRIRGVNAKKASENFLCFMSTSGGIPIRKGTTCTLTIPPPEKMELTVRQSGGELIVRRELPAAPRLEYTSVRCWDSETPKVGLRAPSVRIYAAGREEPLVQGIMRYG